MSWSRALASLVLLVVEGWTLSCVHDREAFGRSVAGTRAIEEAASRFALDRALTPGDATPARVACKLLRWEGADGGEGGSATFRIETALIDDSGSRQLSRSLCRGRVVGGKDLLELREIHCGEPSIVTRVRPAFRDATLDAGLADVHREPDLAVRNRLVLGIWPGSGAGAADVDGDGDLDLLALDGRRSILYANDGAARFTDVTAAWGLEGLAGTGCAFADFDDDGDPELLVTNAFGGNRFFENRGTTYVDRTPSSGTAWSPKGSSVAVADYDGDGRLDAYVCNSGDYYSFLPDPVWNARNGYPNALFRNMGDLRFEDRARAAGVASQGWSLAAAFADDDLDGDQDLYVANDFGLNHLYRNRGDGTFRDVAGRSGTSDRGYGMSVTWGDYDGDGLEDLYVSNIESHYAFLLDDPNFPLPPLGRVFRGRVIPMMRKMLSGNTLLRNLGGGSYEDRSEQLAVAEGGWSWGALFVDYDLDGRLDLISPNGFVSGPSREDCELDFWVDSSEHWDQYLAGEAVFDMKGRSLHGHQRDALFRGNGGDPFEEVAFVEGADLPGDARGAVRADLDGDGDPDLYVRQVKQPGVLLRNESSAPRIVLDLRKGSGAPALGARARIRVGDRDLFRVVRAHEGYFSSQDPAIAVGLGTEHSVESVEVRWPSGRRDEIGSQPAGVRVVWQEGGTPRRETLAP